jgi:hypothetical protein
MQIILFFNLNIFFDEDFPSPEIQQVLPKNIVCDFFSVYFDFMRLFVAIPETLGRGME